MAIIALPQNQNTRLLGSLIKLLLSRQLYSERTN